MLATLIAGFAAGYGIAIPVGAVAVLIVETGIRSGGRAAAAAGAGAASADGIYAAVAAIFGAALAGVLTPWDRPIRAAAVVVLAALALHGLRSVARDTAGAAAPWSALSGQRDLGQSGPRPLIGTAGPSMRRTYAAFLGITLLNPLTIAYFAALILGLGGTGTDAAGKTAFVAGAFLASLSWQMLLAGGAVTLRRRLSPRLRLVVGIAGNGMVLAFAAVIAIGLVARA
jgi:arginine exporter protein ArgO